MTDWPDTWAHRVEELGAQLGELHWNTFLVVEVVGESLSGTDLGDLRVAAPPDARIAGPYAQTSRQPSSWYVEAASRENIDVGFDEAWLSGNGWRAPGHHTTNWWRWCVGGDEATTDVATVMLRSLVVGRGCRDWRRLRWWTGRHPSGDDGDRSTQPHARPVVLRFAS